MADKEEIRARSDVIEVIGSYVPLKRRGRNWVGLCPFHQEKTPSFNVDPVTQGFKCFGCGVSGDVFDFIERHENMEFVEAAELLARRAGLTFDRKGGQAAPTSERDALYSVNAFAADWFASVLERAPVAKDYLYGRGLAHETIHQFRLGYAPEGWDGLASALRARRQDLRVAEAAGLVRTGTAGSYYDVFRHRVVFPIHDEQERIVGFGGRAFGDDQPKYLNTGETPVFTKSRLLYGLNFGRRQIGVAGCALLMEGYMDVIAAHQAGFVNAVATLGTSLTDEHARKLARMAPAVTLVYDADSAGIKATLRASEILEKEGIQVRVVRLPEGDDPDSLLRRGETAAFQAAIDGAIGRVEYQLERIVAGADLANDEGRRLMLRKVVAILASIPTRSERDVYVARMLVHHPMGAQNPAVAAEMVHRDAEAYAARVYGSHMGRSDRAPAAGVLSRSGMHAGPGARGAHAGSAPAPVPPGGLSAEERAEQELLRALADASFREAVLQAATADDFVTPVGRGLYELLKANPQSLHCDETGLMRLVDAAGDEVLAAGVRERLQDFHALMANVPVTHELIHGCLRRLRQHRVRLLTDELAQMLQSKWLTEADQARVQEHQRLIRELKGTSGPA